MYEDKIKKELFEKIRKIIEINEETLEVMADESFDPADNSKFEDLFCESIDLQDEINELLIDTKYIPLVGLSEEQLKDLDTYLKDREKTHVFDNGKEIIQDGKEIEKHFDIQLLNFKEDMKNRIHKLKHLRMTTHLDQKTTHFYNEVVRCYIYGAFEASCVLCRAITETLAKRFIEYKGYGHLLAGANNKAKTMSVQDICLNILKIDKDVITLYTKIGNNADKILHQKEMIGENTALKMIELLQSFIKIFPKKM